MSKKTVPPSWGLVFFICGFFIREVLQNREDEKKPQVSSNSELLENREDEKISIQEIFEIGTIREKNWNNQI